MSLERIRVVLVRPKSSGNVGAVARAMKNTGIGDLVLVAPRRFRPFPANAMAVHAADVLDRMRIESTLAAAVSDASWVVGTTCRPGAYRRRAMTPRDAAAEIVRVAGGHTVALVFGPEDHGLSNEDLKLCHELVTIPTHAGYSSLNVSQAVLVCLYEIFLARHPARAEPATLATSDQLEQMISRLRDAFMRI
jgi:tRNA/rRNA methyltransferase